MTMITAMTMDMRTTIMITTTITTMITIMTAAHQRRWRRWAAPMWPT